MTNKNPYEIRLEVLQMAQDLVMQQYHANREILMNNWAQEADLARQRNESPEPLSCPDFPTEESIVKKAQFLSEFINSK